MLNDFLVVGGSVLTLFLMMAVGFGLGKKKVLSPGTLGQISTMLLYIVCPIIVVTSLMGESRDASTVRRLLVSAAALAGTYLLNMLLIQLCFRRTPPERRGVVRFASIYGNTVFMGLPLIQAALGAPGMLPVVVSMGVFNVCTWSHGAALIGGRERVSLRKAILNPGVISFAVALVLFITQLRLPAPLTSAMNYLSNLNTPLAMVVIGAQMASADLRSVFTDRSLYAVAAVKLLAVPLVTMLVLLPFRLDPDTFTAIVILAACPTAGATSLFCQLMGKDGALSARLISLTTLLSLVTLPLVASAARAVSTLF